MRSLLIALLALLAVGSAEARNPRGGSVGVVAGPAMPSVIGLHVSGNKIVNSSNQVIQLRGVTLDGGEYMCLGSSSTAVFDFPATSATITALKSWAINVVRLPVNESCWLGINGTPATSNYTAAQYRQAFIDWINLLTASNIAVELQNQWAGPGTLRAQNKINGNTACVNADGSANTSQTQCGLAPMPDADHTPALWTSLATQFSSNSSVLFGLYNEPYPDNNNNSTAAWACLLNGGTCPGVNYTAAGSQSLVNAIRSAGATNIIVVPGVQFTNVLSQWNSYKPADILVPAQIAASWHSYSTQICNTQSCWDSQVAPVAANVPVVTEEIGENDCQGVYIDPLMTWLDGKGASYLAWAWNAQYPCSSFPSVISDFAGTPTGFGIDFENHLLSLAGLPPYNPPPIPYFNNAVFPYGLAPGRTGNYTASDGTVYFGDPTVQSGPGDQTVAVGLTENMQFFQPYSTSNTITNTTDTALYQTGRYGVTGTWTFAVPNGNYNVTLGMAPLTSFTQTTVNDASTSSINNAGEFGQDQKMQDNQVGTCKWSQYFNGTNSPYSTPATSCPANGGGPIPTVNAATTVTYTVSVFNQQLKVSVAASFGGGRKTILSSIKITQAP